MVWSALGFALLVTALSIELYPLANAFWTKAGIQDNPTANNFGNKYFNLLLSNFDAKTGQNYSNTITTCFRCALAVLAAFSSILGRAGSLECLLVSLVGIIGFELNRQVISNLGTDSFGTFSIFTFGGFMGLAVGYILKLREDLTEGSSTERHLKYNASYSSVALSTFGAMIIFLAFPYLAMELDAYHGINNFNVYTGPFYVIVAMGAAIIGSIIVSCFINGTIIPRDLINAPIAGGIISGSASFFITNPVYALVVGFCGGAIQAVIQNIAEKPQSRNNSILSTISWSLFGIQGLLGGVFATGYRDIINHNSNGITFSAASINYNPGYELLIAVISAGMGLGFGCIAGLLVYAFNGQTSNGHFDDKEYWVNSDGISYPKEQIIEVKLTGRGISPTPEGPIDEEGEFYFEEPFGEVKDSHAYL